MPDTSRTIRQRRRAFDLAASPWEYIDAAGDCWIWTAARSGNGYGSVKWKGRQRGSHCVVYELLVGLVPDGKQLDHLCRNILCCNPDHLQVVSASENQRRGYSPVGFNARADRCARGHPYDSTDFEGYRSCSVCRAARHRRYRERHIDEARDKDRRYREANLERIRERQRVAARLRRARARPECSS